MGCEEELAQEASFTDYTYTTLDEDGGSWKPVLIQAAQEIPVAPPADITSSTYLEEVDDVKQLSGEISSAQRKAIRYWSNNPILRWNEIALELVAKYNLIPGPNADGTYPAPNPEKPGDVPYFPYTHPPYTCRMLAYLSVAQFDGLVTAWHYKFMYNRPAPFEVDESIPAPAVYNSVPAYPSDGAVIALISRDILSAMFPLEKEYLAQLAEEQLYCLQASGVNVASDLAAGEVIAKAITAKALARASTDGMKKAQAPKAVSDSIRNAAINQFGWSWTNMETPERPVGLTPLFGKVKLWNVPNVEAVRPVPPPAPGSDEFNENVKELKDIAANMTQERRRIANWWADGLNTYTPPGHWNRFAKEYIIKYQVNPLRSARILAYLNMAIMDAGISCWDAKYYYHYPRPIEAIPGFKTIVGTPNFPSYTSGHSTFSAAASEVLSYFFPQDRTQFEEWANEAAESRIYGGIHYRFDSEVGLKQGREVAQYTIDVARQDGAD